MIPFSHWGIEGPTTMHLLPGETGLPDPSWLKGHYITVFPKKRLLERLPRQLSAARMRAVSAMIRRAFDPDAPWEPR
jgi:mRNA-degrading endonuclease toxin of MazEF toxin-antitoxin module